MKKIRFNKTRIEKLPFPKNGQIFYLDTVLPGFGLRVGKTKKAFYVEKKINTKSTRVTIGTYPQIFPDQARIKAQELLSQMTLGINPNQVKKTQLAMVIPLGKAFKDFMDARKRRHKPRTVINYERTMKVAFNDWQSIDITKISNEMVSLRHTSLGDERGEADTNTHFRILRAVLNFAAIRYEYGEGSRPVFKNPVNILTDRGQWFINKRRDRWIKGHQLSPWYSAVNNLNREMVRDFFLLLLFTGLRKLEAAKLKWSDIDFIGKTLYVSDTKNGKPLTLPLSDFIFELLQNRRKKVEGSGYIFSTPGKLGYFVNPTYECKKVIAECGIEFSSHDLRRTFITVGARLVTGYELKMLVNHAMGSDVTHGYIIVDEENLRKPMQIITNTLLRLCHGEKGNVIPLISAKTGNKLK